ncbi:2382_t:CDS:2 [Cetraspora pellucida]|uniref:2382_t:CDS:1 n=1 Tax=Cetraspora pellucida TaxID=1433469 RepID=A0ACA9KPV6_9GLOM|nr:2382_t:CDS:2 [Cetraspora pellucida]
MKILVKKILNWLNIDGQWLQLEVFSDTRHGVKTLQFLKSHNVVLTVPGSHLWTIDVALSDPVIGTVIHTVEPLLSVDDILAVFLLFIKSCEIGYDGRQVHVKLLPISYTTSICFNDEELKICAGSLLYHLIQKLKQQISDDYLQLFNNLITKLSDLFPLEKFTKVDALI